VDVSAVRAEIKDVLQAALTGWRVESYLPESPNPPCLLVGYPTDIVYNATLRAHARITMPIMVLVGAADARSAQLRMDEALGTDSGSVVDALHGTSGTAWFGSDHRQVGRERRPGRHRRRRATVRRRHRHRILGLRRDHTKWLGNRLSSRGR
jgi:hypothetical protein